MSDILRHPAGALMGFANPPHNNHFAELLRPPPAPIDDLRQGSRRRKLWELPHKCHCPLIGVCFDVAELRARLAKRLQCPPGTGDFVLHTSAVGHCDSRSEIAEILHKTLENRFQADIRKFASAKNVAELRRQWQQTHKNANATPGALWACWTHPACDPALEQEIYADIHMLQHQIAGGRRSETAAQEALQQDNRLLRKQLAEAHVVAENLRCEKSRETARLGERVAELRLALVRHEAYATSLNSQLETLRQSLPDLKNRLLLARRANDAEARASALTARLAELEEMVELHNDQRQPAAATDPLRSTDMDNAAAPMSGPGAANLSGKCILCVGGRSGALDAYRRIVEERGGRFLHHDGGQEESLHRIDAALSAADLVVCQAGCISHNAYWRVKDQCKRHGKPCIFLKGPGISSFGRVLNTAYTPVASHAAN